MSITINELLDNIKIYNNNISDLEMIKKAYKYADYLHEGQLRQSGEKYIIHPLCVAYILSEMHVDTDTICASLLHDTIEDTNCTKEDIINLFNKDIATLVDGVTKISKLNFSTKEDCNLANTRKILTSITEDVRIIIIKLADRLHNMRTLEYKSEFKQKEISLETLELYVPLSYYIGSYRLKSELEDLSFKYLYRYTYNDLNYMMNNYYLDNEDILKEMYYNINTLLDKRNIKHEIKIRTKNIYGIYKKLKEGYQLSDIHDLLALKIMVDDIYDCYITLGLIHSQYKPVSSKFKDYICNPKTNLYESLHTTVFGENDRLVQTQIRTFDMDKVASFGLATYFDINKGNARDIMQEELRNKFQFYKSLKDFDVYFDDNKEFIDMVKKELFSDMICVYCSKGEVIQLSKGSSVVDLFNKINDNFDNNLIGAKVNEKPVRLDYILKDNDRVCLLVDKNIYLNNNYIRKKVKLKKGLTNDK